MIRILIILLVGYLAYRLVRGWLGDRKTTGRMNGKQAGRIDDLMVKDPQCGAYFARRQGVALKSGRDEMLFCSPECREKYLAAHAKPGE
jgi:uncharacterized protein